MDAIWNLRGFAWASVSSEVGGRAASPADRIPIQNFDARLSGKRAESLMMKATVEFPSRARGLIICCLVGLIGLVAIRAHAQTTVYRVTVISDLDEKSALEYKSCQRPLWRVWHAGSSDPFKGKPPFGGFHARGGRFFHE